MTSRSSETSASHCCALRPSTAPCTATSIPPRVLQPRSPVVSRQRGHLHRDPPLPIVRTAGPFSAGYRTPSCGPRPRSTLQVPGPLVLELHIFWSVEGRPANTASHLDPFARECGLPPRARASRDGAVWPGHGGGTLRISLTAIDDRPPPPGRGACTAGHPAAPSRSAPPAPAGMRRFPSTPSWPAPRTRSGVASTPAERGTSTSSPWVPRPETVAATSRPGSSFRRAPQPDSRERDRATWAKDQGVHVSSAHVRAARC